MPRINLVPFTRKRSPFARAAYYRRPYSAQALTAIGREASPSSPIGSSPLGWYHVMYPKYGSPVMDAGIDMPPFAPGTTEPGTEPREPRAYAASGYGGGYSAPTQQTYPAPGTTGADIGSSINSITTWARKNAIIVVIIVVLALFAFFQFGRKK